MPSPKRLLAGACGFLVALGVLAESQTRSILGRVTTKSAPVPEHTEVSIDRAGTYLTTASGKFEIPLSPALKVGFPVTFQVNGWVVIDPCVLARGRTYLPDPEAEPIPIEVLRPGDRGLLSDNSIGCIVKERDSQFSPRSGSASGPRSSLSGRSMPVVAELRRPISPRWSEGSDHERGHARLVTAKYRPNLSLDPGPPPQERRESKQQMSDQYLADQAKQLGLTEEELATAIGRWANSVEDPYLKGLAALYERRYAEASRCISESIASSTGDTLERYVPLALAEYEQGHYSAAEIALRKVLAVHADDPLVLNNLGIVLDAEAKYGEAEPLYKRAWAIDEQALGPEHQDVATDLNNLAVLYQDQGKYGAAEPLYRRALAIDEKALGPDHPSVATRLNNLALLYLRLGKYGEAEPLHKRALAIDEKALGPDHAYVATDLNNLARLYKLQGKYGAAEPLYMRALAIDEKVLGPGHPDVANHLDNLAVLYQAQGKYGAAEPLYMRALAIDEKALGPEHPDVAKHLYNLALL